MLTGIPGPAQIDQAPAGDHADGIRKVHGADHQPLASAVLVHQHPRPVQGSHAGAVVAGKGMALCFTLGG